MIAEQQGACGYDMPVDMACLWILHASMPVDMKYLWTWHRDWHFCESPKAYCFDPRVLSCAVQYSQYNSSRERNNSADCSMCQVVLLY